LIKSIVYTCGKNY